MNLQGLRIALVGPLPPPAGGIANQTRQLSELLEKEGARVVLVACNAPYRPLWIGKVRAVRAVFRLLPYALRLWRVAAQADVFHVMANSGWSWHLFAAPAVLIARARGIPVVVNYRGGQAKEFLERSGRSVAWTLRKASVLAVPSGFLREVFARHGLRATVVPNIVDLECFRPSMRPPAEPHIVVARNLDAIYDVATALRAFALIRQDVPRATMTIAGEGPERASLARLAAQLGVAGSVVFAGALGRAAMAELYRSACVVLNPSRVDNMPNSVLEAMASGAPVVSTNVGGVPFLVQHEVTGLLVPPGEPPAMARAAMRILAERGLAERLRREALADAQQYAWARVKTQWAAAYEMAA